MSGSDRHSVLMKELQRSRSSSTFGSSGKLERVEAVEAIR